MWQYELTLDDANSASVNKFGKLGSGTVENRHYRRWEICLEIEDSFILDENNFANALASAHLLLREENEDHNNDNNYENDEDINENNNKYNNENNNDNNDDNEDIYIRKADTYTRIAESDDQKLQEKLLSLVTPALTIFNNEITSKNSTSTKKESEKLPSKLLVLTALKIGKVRLNLLMKEKFQIKNLEDISIVGENLGKNVLSSYSKIQENINQLENSSSYEDYFNALPETISQSEKNRLSTLIAEYTDDVVASQSVCAIESRKDSLWSLASKLWDAFNHPDPKTHPLFKGVPELNEEGIVNILSFYEIGKSRLQKILDQDVYKTEPRSTSKCHMCNVNSYTYTQLKDKEDKEKKTNKRVDNLPQESIIQESISSTSQQMQLPFETDRTKNTRCKTTEAEKAIHDQLFESEELSETTVSNVLLQLNTVSSD
ncbi:2169_t:CDS:2 [Scutellospora calospora]|uniref:2169_t:CDS:1 n=1 Tax=Scutellospora calospora TaxID=85575 RepID=A0ACA9KQM7_9GLOM|nr:2169_t:CDS:2 [Scutellospora calospora]